MAGVEDPIRGVVATELVRAIFANGQSGYLEMISEPLVVETPGTVLTSLVQPRKKK
jgi:hypothetical protein